MGVFIPQKWANAANRGFPLRVFVKYWPAHHCCSHWHTPFSGSHEKSWGCPSSWYSVCRWQRIVLSSVSSTPVQLAFLILFGLTSVYLTWNLSSSSLFVNEPWLCFRLFRVTLLFFFFWPKFPACSIVGTSSVMTLSVQDLITAMGQSVMLDKLHDCKGRDCSKVMVLLLAWLSLWSRIQWFAIVVEWHLNHLRRLFII